MQGRGIEVNLSYKSISLSYAFITLSWQLITIYLSLLISKGINDTRIIFIIGTYVGHALIVGGLSAYLTTYWYFLANVADRFCIVNSCLRLYE